MTSEEHDQLGLKQPSRHWRWMMAVAIVLTALAAGMVVVVILDRIAVGNDIASCRAKYATQLANASADKDIAEVEVIDALRKNLDTTDAAGRMIGAGRRIKDAKDARTEYENGPHRPCPIGEVTP